MTVGFKNLCCRYSCFSLHVFKLKQRLKPLFFELRHCKCKGYSALWTERDQQFIYFLLQIMISISYYNCISSFFRSVSPYLIIEIQSLRSMSHLYSPKRRIHRTTGKTIKTTLHIREMIKKEKWKEKEASYGTYRPFKKKNYSRAWMKNALATA